METKILLSVTEAADAVGVCRSKLYELLADGKLESVKIGARRLIPADALEAFVSDLRRDASVAGDVA